MDNPMMAQVFAELDEIYHQVEAFQVGDITVEAWKEHYGVCDNTARLQMVAHGKRPGWQTLHVSIPGVSGRPLVLRKVDASADR